VLTDVVAVNDYDIRSIQRHTAQLAKPGLKTTVRTISFRLSVDLGFDW